MENRATKATQTEKAIRDASAEFDLRVSELEVYFGVVARHIVLSPESAALQDEANLTFNEMRLIEFVGKMPRPTMGAIASSLGIAINSASGLVSRLVKRKLLMRKSIPSDRRVVLVELTSQGQVLCGLIGAHHKRVISTLLKHLDLPEQMDLIRLHKRIAERLHRRT